MTLENMSDAEILGIANPIMDNLPYSNATRMPKRSI